MATDRITVVPVPGHGAEDVLVDAKGHVWTGTDDGSILRLTHDGDLVERVANTGGRPLGLEFLGDGRVLVCDADRGLLALDPATREVETLVTSIEGRRMRFCNNASVAADGAVYFSDTSLRFGVAQWKSELIETTCTGRLLVRRADGEVDVLCEGLDFANGVALAPDESFVAVAETGARTVVRHWLTGPRTGDVDYLAEDLPGYPDNISLGTDGLIWVTIASPTDAVLETLKQAPTVLRRAARRLPDAVQPRPKRTARVIALRPDGTQVHDRSFDAAGWHMATGVREHHGRVWLGSLVQPAVAWFDL
ncbi:MAG: SMP-30/gluconolactonase/LRE family protein [Dermatophilaceae bacterium]